MYNKKGQAALEFLMTYGWAILAAIIVIGALGSYFYFNQGGSSSVVVNPPFYGIASQVNTTGVIIEIDNRGTETAEGVFITISDSGCTETLIDDSWTSSEAVKTVYIPCTTGTAGGSYSGNIVVKYQRPDSNINQTITGSISGPIV